MVCRENGNRDLYIKEMKKGVCVFFLTLVIVGVFSILKYLNLQLKL